MERKGDTDIDCENGIISGSPARRGRGAELVGVGLQALELLVDDGLHGGFELAELLVESGARRVATAPQRRPEGRRRGTIVDVHFTLNVSQGMLKRSH